ncbi:MAG TPA: F0F1 ATP synthase subunit A [Stellaceae bacterium]|nr:F0F1 ATP synthase subunit A [Stellaceae bacterium]
MAEVSAPLEQFVIKPLIPIHVGSLNISYTNSALLMTIIVALIMLLLLGATRRGALVPGRLQSVAELSYEFVVGMMRQEIGEAGIAFFPLVFSIFMFVLFANFIGLIPYSFSVTGQIVVTAALALFVFVVVTFVGFLRHGLHFFHFFLPPGAPLYMAPVIVPIEIISYLSRPVSLSIRLFANMMAGHTMMAVFAGFTITLGIFGFFPIAINVAMFGLEVIVCALQAYVFTILTVLYLRDAILMH